MYNFRIAILVESSWKFHKIFGLVCLYLIFISFLASAQNISRPYLSAFPRRSSVRNRSIFRFQRSNSSVRLINGRRSSLNPIDCFGIGSRVAQTLEGWFTVNNSNSVNAQDVRFFFSSRAQPQRVHVIPGEQFGLEWTDFKIERRTVLIVHGFLSHGNETWIRQMEEAFLMWGDVNVIVVDWAGRANTFNYYRAVVNTRIVGNEIARLLHHIVNATITVKSPDEPNWGTLHLVGHSLGAHICGFASSTLKRRQDRWNVSRITGLDPAHPCFNNVTSSMRLDRNDAPFVDVIHTNGQQQDAFGLGSPHARGHADFYPNGGKTQPGCARVQGTFFDLIPIPRASLEQAICSHGRSYLYLIESLIAAVNGECTFCAHHWDRTYRRALQLMSEPCDMNNCSEMGIRAELHPQRGTFFVITSRTAPFCAMDGRDTEEVRRQLQTDYKNEILD